jgi:type II secretion system protein J
MKIHLKRRMRGFTLVEILIAMAILMVIISAIYSSWTAILRSSQAGLKAAAEVQRVRMTMKCLEESLASTVYFTENAAYYSFETDTASDFAYLSFVSRLQPTFPGSGLFPDQPMRRITFEVVPGENGNDLRMTQASLLQVLQQTEEAYPITLMTNVSHFTLEFWDDQNQDWAYEWLETNSVPQMIRFSVGFGKTGNSPYAQEDVQSKTVFIAGMAITKEYQMPDATVGAGRNNNRGRGGPGGGGGGGNTGGQGGNNRGNGRGGGGDGGAGGPGQFQRGNNPGNNNNFQRGNNQQGQNRNNLPQPGPQRQPTSIRRK